MKYDLVIFDLDGTLLDTVEDLRGALNHALAEAGYPEKTKDEMKLIIGGGVYNHVVKALPAGTDKAVITILENVSVLFSGSTCPACAIQAGSACCRCACASCIARRIRASGKFPALRFRLLGLRLGAVHPDIVAAVRILRHQRPEAAVRPHHRRMMRIDDGRGEPVLHRHGEEHRIHILPFRQAEGNI